MRWEFAIKMRNQGWMEERGRENRFMRAGEGAEQSVERSRSVILM